MAERTVGPAAGQVDGRTAVGSAAEENEGQEFVGDVGGGHGGHLRVVVGRCDLHHIRADQAQAGQAAQDAEQFPRGQAARLRGAGAGSMGRVEHVDVDRQVLRRVADPLADPGHRLASPVNRPSSAARRNGVP